MVDWVGVVPVNGFDSVVAVSAAVVGGEPVVTASVAVAEEDNGIADDGEIEDAMDGMTVEDPVERRMKHCSNIIVTNKPQVKLSKTLSS